MINLKEKISFSWDLHYICNYRCPYCWWDGKWHELAKLNRYLSVEEWMKYWRDIYSKYGNVFIEILGGEPFIYPNFTELIKELSDLHHLRITTNLSIDIEDFVSQIDSSKVKVSSTFHPLFADFDSFVRKAMLLKDNGLIDNINYLAYPAQIKQIPYYKDRFSDRGLFFSVMTFWGSYNGITYPNGYSEEEKAIIGINLGKRADEEFQLEPKKMPKGKLCRAGQKYAVIQGDGNVLRCGGSGLIESIGNFFDRDFRLLEEPMPCKAEYCKCNEWAFLLEEEKSVKKVPKFPRLDSPYRVFWNWDITYECNYICSYCNIIHNKLPCRQDQAKQIHVDIDRWKKVWDRIFEKYYTGIIRISGGEPSIYSNFFDLVAMLSVKYVVDITTNLSFDMDSFLTITRPGNIAVSASFHPEFDEFEKFLNKLNFLYQKGYPVSVCIVAFPPYLEEIERYKDMAEERKILFKISPFTGEFEGRLYPQGYTDIERKYLERMSGNASSSKQIDINTQWYQYKVSKMQDKNTDIKEKLCRMGQMYARILPNGDVSRCCVPDSGNLGNIFDEDFRLLDYPEPCKVDTACPCFKAMVVNKQDIWLPLWECFEHKTYKLNHIRKQ